MKGVAAGSNLEMPSCGYDSAREVIAAVRNGKLKEADLDERVGELVDAVMELTSGRSFQIKTLTETHIINWQGKQQQKA